jgi:hypothetical protein
MPRRAELELARVADGTNEQDGAVGAVSQVGELSQDGQALSEAGCGQGCSDGVEDDERGVDEVDEGFQEWQVVGQLEGTSLAGFGLGVASGGIGDAA